MRGKQPGSYGCCSAAQRLSLARAHAFSRHSRPKPSHSAPGDSLSCMHRRFQLMPQAGSNLTSRASASPGAPPKRSKASMMIQSLGGLPGQQTCVDVGRTWRCAAASRALQASRSGQAAQAQHAKRLEGACSPTTAGIARRAHNCGSQQAQLTRRWGSPTAGLLTAWPGSADQLTFQHTKPELLASTQQMHAVRPTPAVGLWLGPVPVAHLNRSGTWPRLPLPAAPSRSALARRPGPAGGEAAGPGGACKYMRHPG